jgi:hypothetical protein
VPMWRCAKVTLVNQNFSMVTIEVALVSNDLKLRFPLGTQGSAKWNPGGGLGIVPSISYSLGPKQVQVSLVCSDSTTAEFEPLGESPINTFRFRLTHKCACWDECKGKLRPNYFKDHID